MSNGSKGLLGGPYPASLLLADLPKNWRLARLVSTFHLFFQAIVLFFNIGSQVDEERADFQSP